jgi:hypothetical protein
MTRRRVLGPILCSALAFAIASVAPAAADDTAENDGWIFVLTPQTWIPHIDSGGFSGNQSLGSAATFINNAVPGAGAYFKGEDSEAVDNVNVQWGLQFAAKKGRWTLAAGYQGSDYETRTDLVYQSRAGATIVLLPSGETMSPGDRAAREYLNTSRTDVDFAATYAFLDVVPNKLDLTIGGGLKLIHAEATRYYSDMNPVIAYVNGQPPPGLYQKCLGNSTCSGGLVYEERVKSTDWMYGVTIPMSAVFHLSDDARWLFPLSVMPFLGAETRDDHHIVYGYNYNSNGVITGVDRKDGTYFAYGVTADATLRHALTDSVWAYLGMRVQYMNGDSPGSDAYLAYGPLLGISASFQL